MPSDPWNLKHATTWEDPAMGSVTVTFRPPEPRHDLEAIRGEWGGFAVPVVSLVVLGFVALGSLLVASLATAAP
jgi:hypothetical protein